MHLTYNTRILTESPEDYHKIIEILEAQQFAFDACSSVMYQLKDRCIVKLHKKFYKSFRKLHPEIPAGIVAIAQREVSTQYKSMESRGHKITQVIKKKNLSLQLDENLFRNATGFKVSSLIPNKTTKFSIYLYPRLQEVLLKYKLCYPHIYVRKNELWIGLVFEVPEQKINGKLALGVDLGIRRAAATSEGKIFIDKKFNAEMRRLRYLKRSLQSKRNKDKSKSAKRHLKQLKRRQTHKNKNQTHLLANAILKTSANIIVLENLKGIKTKKK